MTESEYRAQEESRLDREIRLYARKRGAGEPVAHLHEELLDAVQHVYDESVGEYFDRHGSLPYVANNAVSWPVSRSSSNALTMGRILASLIVFGVFVAFVRFESLTLQMLLAAVMSMLCWQAIFPFVARRFPPQDVERRNGDAAEYREICVEQKKALNIKAEEAARARRQGRKDYR